MDERILIEGIKRGESQSLERLMDIYMPYVTTVIRNVVKRLIPRQDIEEIAADVFISFWRHAADFTTNSQSIKQYIAAMARNKAKTALALKKINPLPLDEDQIAIECSPEDAIICAIACRQIRDAILGMTEPDREIFLRRYFYYQTIKQIAAQMKMKAKTVETRLLRGREKLRGLLTERGVIL